MTTRTQRSPQQDLRVRGTAPSVRRLVTWGLAAALVAGGALPAGAQTAAGGSARAAVELGSVDDLDLGGLEATATTDGQRLGRVAADLAGETALEARSDGPPVADATVTLAGGGTLRATALEAADEGGEVRATVAALDAELAGRLGLEASATAIEARVAEGRSSARQGVRLDASVTLDDLLGAETVDGLSLDLLVDLGARLRAGLDGEVAATLDDVLALRATLRAGAATEEQIAAVAALDLGAFRTGLADRLGATELVGVDGLEVSVTAEATDRSSVAAAVCTGTVRVLETARVVADCGELVTALDDLEIGLTALLEGLPTAAPVTVSVTGATVDVTAANARQGDDLIAEARVAGPSLEVGPITLTATAGEDSLAALLQGVTGQAAQDLLADLAAVVPDGTALVGVELGGIAVTTASVSASTSSPAGPGAPGGPGDPGVPPEGPGDPEECQEPPADGQDPCTTRDAGGDRIDTAVHVSAAAFPGGAEVALLARSDVYADALAGAPLAGSGGGPILLTVPDDVVDGVVTELERLGVTRGVLLGGEVALDASVQAELRGMGLAVERIGGENRFGTAALIAAELGASHPVAFVVEGYDPDPGRGWPDAVSAAPYAAATGRPVLLATTDAVPAETAEALRRHGVGETIVVGGEAAVGAGVHAQLASAGHGPRRLAGADRFATNVAVAAEAERVGGLSAAGLYLATGEDWPDALVVGPAAAARGDLLLLIDGDDLNASPATRAALRERADEIRTVRIVGGPGTVSPQVEAQVMAALDAR